MQPQEIDKIKNLVKASSLLSSLEKEEWLALAGIMNDKQLWELKKILETTGQAARVMSQELLVKQESLGKSLEPKAAGIPPLTHILNAPKVGTAVFPGSRSQESRVISQESLVKSQKAAIGDQKAGFWKKIKDVLAEKELPAGRLEAIKELELPAPGMNDELRIRNYELGKKKSEIAKSSPVGLPPKPLVVPRPPARPASAPVAPVSIGSESGEADRTYGTGKTNRTVLAAPSEKNFPRPADLHVGTLSVNKLVMPGGAKPQTPNNKSQTRYPAPQAIDGKSSNKLEDKLFVAGLKDAGILLDAKFAAATSKPSFVRPGRTPEGEPTKTRALSSLNELAALDTKDLTRVPSTALAEQLKGLVKHFGYHKVEFALERSPIFKGYLNTGMASLAGKYNLDAGAPQSGMLSKEQFEAFADVLRKIKN